MELINSNVKNYAFFNNYAQKKDHLCRNTKKISIHQKGKPMNNNTYWKQLTILVEQEASNNLLQQKESFAFYQKLESAFNDCLISEKYTSLFKFLDYFENSEAHPNIRYSAETRRVYSTLLFLKLELEMKSEIFISSVSTYKEFQTQYIQTVFALRRLELQINPDLIQEAIEFIRSIPLSSYAACGIIENEYFENYKTLYWSLYHAKQDQWTLREKTYFLFQIAKHDPSMRTYLELSMLFMENREYQQAYNMLMKIPDPTPEIETIKTSLKGILSK